MSEEKNIEVAIIEDIVVLRENVVYFMELTPDIDVMHEAGSIESYLLHLENHSQFHPDILLLDIGLPGMSGLEAIPIIKEKQPNTDIIMLSAFEEEATILKALCQGAVGYISKRATQEEIAEGIRVVKKGGSYMSPQIAREIVKHLFRGNVKQVQKPSILTDRQVEIIEGLVEGRSYGEIADCLFLNVETIRTHIKKMYRTLAVNNKAEAIAMYLKGEIG